MLRIFLAGFVCGAVLLGGAERVVASSSDFCFQEAGEIYGVHPTLLWAIAKQESNFNPQAVNRDNKNKSLDFGLMQINSEWARPDRLGMDVWNSLGDPCYNIKVGAYILADCLRRLGNTPEGLGCYNAKSPEKRIAYAKKIMKIIDSLKVEGTVAKHAMD